MIENVGRARRIDALLVRRIAAGVLLLGLLLGTTDCAYFNTFYHAKKAYAKAEQLQHDAKSDKLAPAAVREYERAIEKCAKVIVEHGGGWKAGIDQALFLMGASYYGKREYETSIKKFNELLLNYPDTDLADDALFYTGLCYHEMRNQGTAKRIFDRLLEKYPEFKRRDEIYLTLAAGLESQGDDRAALTAYRAMLREFSKSKRREDALERIAEISFEDEAFDSALQAYEDLVQITQDDERYFRAQLRIGACFVQMGEHERALRTYEKILPNEPERTDQGGQVWLAMADAENRRGNHEKAIESLELVSENFKNKPLALQANFSLGYTHEVYVEDYPAARAAYEEAINARGASVFKDQAARRLENLGYLEELQAAEAEDAEGQQRKRRAEAAFKRAEFTYFETGDVLAALEQYRLAEEDFRTSEIAPRAAYARGFIYYTELDSLAKGLREFTDVVERYPASPQAERAFTYLVDEGLEPERQAAYAVIMDAARHREQLRADSIAAVQAIADSIAAVEAALEAARHKAQADSLSEVRRLMARSSRAGAVVAEMRSAQAYADSLQRALEAEASAAAHTSDALMHAYAEAQMAPAAPESLSAPPDSAAGSDSLPSVTLPDSAQVYTAAARAGSLRIARDELTMLAQAQADSLAAFARAVLDSASAAFALADSLAAAARADSLAIVAAVAADSLAAIAIADSLAAVRRAADQAIADSIMAVRRGEHSPFGEGSAPAESTTVDSMLAMPPDSADAPAGAPRP